MKKLLKMISELYNPKDLEGRAGLIALVLSILSLVLAILSVVQVHSLDARLYSIENRIGSMIQRTESLEGWIPPL